MGPENISQKKPQKPSFLHRSKALILTIGCEVLLILSGRKKKAQEGAHILQYRTEVCDFENIPEALRGVKLLFLTDPHIGGNIDTIATEISTQIHLLLADVHPEKTLILHGGDFVCSESGGHMTGEEDFVTVSNRLFHGLSRYPQFGVIGNHDHDNHHFPLIRGHIEDHHEIELLETPEDVQKVQIEGATISIHGIHTLSTFLHYKTEVERNILLDQYIASLNTDGSDCNIVLLHNPDGLEFLLQRLDETHQHISQPTLFLAGHTHGGMFDIPVLRELGLRVCRTQFGRYKGWYGPEGKYSHTGNWKLYVSTGMGNSKGFHYRINAEPEVVMFTL